VDDIGDRIVLRGLVEAYARAVDTCDDDLFRSLWTDDARLTIHDGDQPARSVFEGPDAMTALIEALRRRYRMTFHMVGNHHCIIDGDEAEGEAYCLAHHFRNPDDGGMGPGATDVSMGLRYVDVYRRDPAGGWKFSSRAARHLWRRVELVDVVHLPEVGGDR
jgi:hypothetical protein